MSVIAEIIDTLKIKLENILKNKRFRKILQELKIELAQSAKIILKQSNEIEALKTQYETLKIANSLPG
jgi:hypothetical protein